MQSIQVKLPGKQRAMFSTFCETLEIVTVRAIKSVRVEERDLRLGETVSENWKREGESEKMKK